MSARSRDRHVYLRSHPLLFAVLCVTRPLRILRIGRTVLVHDPEAYREILTEVPLDREAEGTTGGAASRLAGGGLLFDQVGDEHRGARRALVASLGTSGVARIRPAWQAVLERGLTELSSPVDLVPLVKELAGVTACAVTGSAADPRALAEAAMAAASATARAHLPGARLRGGSGRGQAKAQAAVDRLTALLPDPLDAMVAVAAVNTTVAALPRAAAWCARAGLWDQVTPELVVELLRVIAPTPLLPRVAAAPATIRTGRRKDRERDPGGVRLRAGDRLILVARHAAESHRGLPANPRAAAQAVFGAGPHACPGAHLARFQLADFLTALAPHRPVVHRAVAARGTALPGYAELVVIAGACKEGN
jgi:cytochrome P450